MLGPGNLGDNYKELEKCRGKLFCKQAWPLGSHVMNKWDVMEGPKNNEVIWAFPPAKDQSPQKKALLEYDWRTASPGRGNHGGGRPRNYGDCRSHGTLTSPGLMRLSRRCASIIFNHHHLGQIIFITYSASPLSSLSSSSSPSNTTPSSPVLIQWRQCCGHRSLHYLLVG